MRRYEELLELPANALVAIIDTVYRYAASSVHAAPLLDREITGITGNSLRLDRLVDAACSEVSMSGSDWDELTAYLAVTPHQVITPRSAWDEIAGRLLTETIVADGVAWMQRYEALSRLLAHPTGQQAAVAACASLAADRTNQVFVETVSALDASPHPDASRHVLHQLTDPTNERAQYGALLACVRKLRYGHFTEPQMYQLVPVVQELVSDASHYEDAHLLAAELLRHLPGSSVTTGKARLRRVLATDRRLHQVASAGRLVDTEISQPLVNRVVSATVAAMPWEVPSFEDQVLPVLIDKMLFSPVFDQRLYTAIMISGTPYRRALATALARELVGPRLHCLDIAPTVLEALRVLGGAEHRPVIERLITARGLPSAVTVTASSAIGHVGGQTADCYWMHAIGHHSHLWKRTGCQTNAVALSLLTYGLGMTRNKAVLKSVRDDLDRRVARGISPPGPHRTVRNGRPLYGSCRSGHQTVGAWVTHAQWAKAPGRFRMALFHAVRAFLLPRSRLYFRRTHRSR